MLYLQQDSYEASPKAISRRTSYLRVRLEFLPYPHLIATLFNGCAFGPPLPFTATSTWTWVDHPVSGLRILTSNATVMWLCALLRLGFPAAPSLKELTLPVSATRRTVLQKVRGCTFIVLPQLVNTGFQVLFHSPPGVLFTFPSQYSALSVTEEYLALRGGPRLFLQGFSCLAVLWILLPFPALRLRGFHPLRPVFPVPFRWAGLWRMQSEPRDARIPVWALPISLAATLGITFCFPKKTNFCFLFLRLLRCFSSPGSPPYPMDSGMDTQGFPAWVSPFRYLRIPGYLLLPAAFRSLSRLSSALSAKASSLCSFSLNLPVHSVARSGRCCFFLQQRNFVSLLFSSFFLGCLFLSRRAFRVS